MSDMLLALLISLQKIGFLIQSYNKLLKIEMSLLLHDNNGMITCIPDCLGSESMDIPISRTYPTKQMSN